MDRTNRATQRCQEIELRVGVNVSEKNAMGDVRLRDSHLGLSFFTHLVWAPGRVPD